MRPSVNVLNSVGRRLRMVEVRGGGRRMVSTPWTMPFTAGYLTRLDREEESHD